MVFFTIRAIFTMIRDRRIENNSAFFIIKIYRFRANLQNATHFVGVAYPPNKISKTVLKMQAFYTCFMKFCLALNSYKIIINLVSEHFRSHPLYHMIYHSGIRIDQDTGILLLIGDHDRISLF